MTFWNTPQVGRRRVRLPVRLLQDLRVLYGMHGIALTGYGEGHYTDQCEAAGFHAVLVKPVTHAQLSAAVRAGGGRGPRLTAGRAAPPPWLVGRQRHLQPVRFTITRGVRFVPDGHEHLGWFVSIGKGSHGLNPACKSFARLLPLPECVSGDEAKYGGLP